MSKNVSNNFKNIIKAGGPFYSYVIMKLSNGTEITLTSENDFTISGTGYSEGENSGFPLGSALSKTVTLNLDNTTMTGALQDVDSDNILDTQNDEIITQENSLGNDYYYARFTLYTEADLPDGTTERIQEGVFTVIDSVAPGDVLEITGYDDMYKADTEFVSTLTYPVSAQQLLNEVCSKCDITLGSASFKNNNYQIQQAPEGLTGRQVIGYIAQIAGGNAVINPSGQLIIKSYDFSDFVDEDVIAGEIETESGIHILSEYINDPDISTDDVTITGVSTTIESDDSDEDETYLVGSEYYAIKIDNPLIVGNEKTAIDLIADSIIGITMRPFSGTFMPDPTIEFMDLCYVIEKRDATYKSFITSHDFDYIGSSNVSCGVESPERYSGTYYSNASEVYQKAKKQIQNNKTQWEQAIENLSQQVANASGLYTTEETQPDGSTIFYMHNKPTLEESDIVWKMTAETLTVSTDGGKTWNAGITVNGQVIAQIMSTIGLNFDWGVGGTLIIQDASGNQTAYIDAETGTVRLSVEELKIVGKTVEEIANEESETVLNDFVDSVYTPTITNLQNQIDGQIETWFYNYIPTAENYPASEWTTDTEKDKHLGDLFYVVDNAEYGGQAYRWAKIGTDYLWDYVEDTAVVKALADAATAKDTADQKRRVFVTTPYPPYDVGDLWVGDDTSDMMRCQVSRQSGNYVSTDWIKAVKYTDDTELYNFIQTDYTETIQEIYESVDQKSETWYQSEDPSLNWTEKENVSLSDMSSDVILDVSGEEITTIFESEKSKHEGDLWKDSDTNVEYIYKDGVWIEMPIPDDVFDKIDGKAQIFVTQPVPPYSIGDLWFNSDTSDIMTCINSRDNGSYNEGDWQKRNKYTDDTYAEQVENDLNDFSEAVTEGMDNLQTQIDGKIETWYYEHEPTLENEPASAWTTDAEKQKHVGDLFYWQSNGHSYRFTQAGDSTFTWTLIQDSDIQNALITANNAQDTADNKRRVFVVTPQPPYDIGDLWCNGEDILTCSTARPQGSLYVSSDWEKLNSYTDDTLANEALEEARQARNLNIILDNEYQGIPADYEGNIGTFPEVKTFVQVLYGHTDVSTDCIYAITKSNSVTGSWDNATRTYTVTGLSEDTGWVDITASYLSLFTTTKRFNVQKVKDGEPGEDGPPGAAGAPGRTYTIEPSVNVLKRASDNSIAPNFIEFNAYYRDGNSATRTAYAGRWIIEETADGDEWTTIYTSSANENSVTHYLYSMLADSDGSAIANASGDTIGIPRDIVAIRAKLYAAGGTTNLLDMQSVAVVIDVDNLTHEEIFNLLTNNGAIQGIYQEGNQLYINAEYIQTGTMSADRIYGGTLTLGGANNNNGTMITQDENGDIKSEISNEGIEFYESSHLIGKINPVYFEDVSKGALVISGSGEYSGVVALSRGYVNGNNITDCDIVLSQENISGLYGGINILSNIYFRERNGISRSLYFENGYITSTNINLTGYNDYLNITVYDGNDLRLQTNRYPYTGNSVLDVDMDIDMGYNDILNQSDERVKTDISLFSESAINIINDIQIYGYTWIESGKSEKAGFIAQQLESDVSADFTKTGKDGVHNVKPTKMIPYIVKAVQELSEEIESLKKEICDLKGESYTLKEHKKDKWKPSDMSLEEKQEFIKEISRTQKEG